MDGDGRTTPRRRRSPPASVTVLGAVVVLLALGAVAFAGVFSSLLKMRVRQKRDELQARLQESRREAEERDAADELLREVALHVHSRRAEEGAFPHRPGTALPDDPWGTPLEYERLDPHRARVRSAGPDRRFGTDDDIEHELD